MESPWIQRVHYKLYGASQVLLVVKNTPTSAGRHSQEDPLEEGMTTHSSILA